MQETACRAVVHRRVDGCRPSCFILKLLCPAVKIFCVQAVRIVKEEKHFFRVCMISDPAVTTTGKNLPDISFDVLDRQFFRRQRPGHVFLCICFKEKELAHVRRKIDAVQKDVLHFLEDSVIGYLFPVPDECDLGDGKPLSRIVFSPIIPQKLRVIGRECPGFLHGKCRDKGELLSFCVERDFVFLSAFREIYMPPEIL